MDRNPDEATAQLGEQRGLLFTRRGSDTLMVSFGGRHEGFNFAGLAARRHYDALFFEDVNLDWYTSGLPGVSGDFATACAYIRAVVRAGGYRTSFFIGQSSGGYAALRFALAIEPDACIAFAPQTRPIADDHRPSVSHPESVVSKPHPGVLDLTELYRTRSSRFPVAIHLCEDESANPPQAYFWDDWAHAGDMRGVTGVEIFVQPCSVHPVAEHLTRTGRLDDVVDHFIKSTSDR